MLTDVDALAGSLGDGRALVIDARPFAEYAKGHIPGAVSLDLFSLHWVDTTPAGIDAFTSHMRLVLSMAGADESRRVVFYDNASGMLAARGAWLLRYFSHPDATMLDGGLGLWRARGHETETALQAPVPSELRTPANPTLVAGYGDILAGGGSLEIVDARTPDEYSGKTVRAARGGHIPGARNVDWSGTLAEDGRLAGPENLAAAYPIARDARIVTYCQGGYRAAHAFVALKVLGYDDVRVYPGSWGEWGNRPELPVEA